jgi:hypothetical protein
MTTGVLARAALIGSIYNRGVHLTTKSRIDLPSAALVNHISTDVSLFFCYIYIYIYIYLHAHIDILN